MLCCLHDATGAGENFSSVFSCGCAASLSLSLLAREQNPPIRSFIHHSKLPVHWSTLCVLFVHVRISVCVCVCEVVPGGTWCTSLATCHRGKMCTNTDAVTPSLFSLLLLTQLVSGLVPVKMDHGWNTIHGSHSWPASNEGRTGTNLPEMDGTKCIHQKLKLRSGDLSLVLIQS